MTNLRYAIREFERRAKDLNVRLSSMAGELDGYIGSLERIASDVYAVAPAASRSLTTATVAIRAIQRKLAVGPW